MKTDKLAYILLQLAPQGFSELIGRSPDDALRYEFKSVELKETAFRLDGVFIPKSDDDITYFVEVQFQLDEQFYARFFAEIFLYLKQYPVSNWRAIVIYASRSVEQKSLTNYQDLLELKRIQRIYLDELEKLDSLSVGLFKLLVEPEQTVAKMAERMAAQASLMNLIEQILTYKFRTLKREEIRQMLKIQEELLKETAFYKEAYEEGEVKAKLATVPLLRRLGLSDEQISAELNLPLTDVQRVPRKEQSS